MRSSPWRSRAWPTPPCCPGGGSRWWPSAELQLSAGELGDADAGVTLLVGAERDGLPEQLVAACDHSARIAIATESLNAAMAATVALYELTRGGELASHSSRVRSS